VLKNTISLSLPRKWESRKAWEKWIPAGVYPDENRGRNDILILGRTFFMLSANVWLLLFNQRKYLNSAIASVCNKNLSFFIDAHLGGIVNPVRKSSAFQRVIIFF
jgi:hypothetical protein